MPTATTTPPQTGSRPRRILGSYTADDGAWRHVLSVRLDDDSHVVIDQRDGADSDMRLVGHIRKDEPAENDRLLAALYIDDSDRRGRCQRLLRLDDLHPEATPSPSPVDVEQVVSLPDGARAKLAQSTDGWRWHVAEGGSQDWQPCTLYQVLGWLGSYEPIVSMTMALVARGQGREHVGALAAQLAQLRGSDRVLVGPIREAVLRAMREQNLTWSEVARRAGYKRAESSAIQRRLGVMPDKHGGRFANWHRAGTLARIVRAVDLDPVDLAVL